jgi:hypothetical protein
MIPIRYLCDPVQPQAAGQLVAKMKAASVWNWLALVDTGFDYQHGGFPALPGIPEPINCYRNNLSLEGILEAAPCLIPLAEDAAARSQQVQTLIAHRGDRPMLSFIAVEKTTPAAALVEQWNDLHWARGTDGDKSLLRFADTRTLARLPEILKPEQWRAFYRNVCQWLYFSREGGLTELLPPKKGEKIARNIELDNAQSIQIMDAALSNAILDNFHKTSVDDYVPDDIPRARLYRLTESALAKMRQADIDPWDDDVHIPLVLYTLKTHGKLLEAPELDGFLRARQWETGHFYEALIKQDWVAALAAAAVQ